MSLHLLHSGLTDTGRVRDGNEDAWAADAAQGLFIVADGMGGHNAGEIAAREVVESLPVMLRRRKARGGRGGPVDGASAGNGSDHGAADGRRPVREAGASRGVARRLRAAVARLSRDLYRRAMTEPGLHGMGATVVAAVVRRGRAVVVHMGDSRAYLLHDGQLVRVTKDHSVVQELIDRGYITPDEAATHPARNRITASVGMPGDPTPAWARVSLAAGDKLLLCTDGLAGMIPDEAIGEVLARPDPPDVLCRALVDAANAAGGHDNITAVVVEVRAGAATAPR